jgi:PAS domain S-box-containing protein
MSWLKKRSFMVDTPLQASENPRVSTHSSQTSTPKFAFVTDDEFATLIIENIHDYAMFLIGLDGQIQSWNSGVERILGYSEDEFVGQPLSLVFTPEDRQAGAPQHELETATRDHRAVDERWHVRKDGSTFWASGILTLLCDEQGQPRGFAKIMRDRTDWKQHEEERERLLKEHGEARKDAEEARARAEEAQQKAETTNRFKDRFISSVSHEMRTPLTTVLGWVSLLRSRALDEDAATQALATIERNTNTLVTLVNDLLDIERIRSDKLRLNIQSVNLVGIVATALESIRPEATAKGLNVHTNITAHRNVLGDAERLRQILLNLLSNAIKFTPAGGSIEVYLEDEDKFVQMCVRDTGKGISRDFLPHVFDQFQQAEESDIRRHGGLGLGLFIAQNLVKLQGGTIEAHSEGEGLGATFCVHLPAAPDV